MTQDTSARLGRLTLPQFGLWAVMAFALAAPQNALRAAEPLWRQIMPRKKVEADPNGDYTLTEKNGPWLIMAASFTGEAGEQEARALVLELRERYNLPAFYYAMRFKIGDERVGRGIDDYGAPIRRRYKRGNEVLEHAVLVGEFPAIDDPEAQSLLERVKTIEPDALAAGESGSTSQSLAAARSFYRSIKGKAATTGPMGHAFVSRNPLLPKEYFTAGLDPEVVDWNSAGEYSLLKCPKKYTIKVATFRGRSTLQGASDASGEPAPRLRLAKKDDPLTVAGKNAHELTVALRSRGWEAYEFHDRHESYVTVGSFDEMTETPDGRLVPATRDAQIIVNTFGASTPNVGFERPAYDELGMDEQDIQKVQQDEALVEKQYEQWMGGVGAGFHPKQFVGLPFDIQPAPMATPRESLGAAYARR
ncbi:MAG TPA: hypothetical protein VEQ85_16865 [Lacipirellulaceae bacterium]|nr:hypothetical protein [Lacipirellulaceae bacterium]